MKNSRSLISTGDGVTIPVTVDLKVNPLRHAGAIVRNMNGKVKMDDEWIYVYQKGYGNYSINVNRAQYCEKVYLANTSLLDSVGSKKITRRLASFLEQVSDKHVFEKNGITYRVYLDRKKEKTIDLDCVKPYWLRQHSPNLPIEQIPERYKSILLPPEKSYMHHAYCLKVDLQKAFNFCES